MKALILALAILLTPALALGQTLGGGGSGLSRATGLGGLTSAQVGQISSAVQAAGGNASATTVTGTANGMGGATPLAALLSDTPSLRLFASHTSNGRIGGAHIFTTTVDNPAGSRTIVMPPNGYVFTAPIITDGIAGNPTSFTGWTQATNGTASVITLAGTSTLAVDIPIGSSIGVVMQDDLPAFQYALYSTQAVNGGVGGNITVPPGIYWLSGTAYSGDAVTLVSGAGVTIAPGSGYPDLWLPAVGGESQSNLQFAASLIKPGANALSIVTTTPVASQGQQNGILVSQAANNQNAGLVGFEVQQHISNSITGTGNQIFGYHLLDFIYPGQKPYFVGNEFEVNDTSGNDESTSDTTDAKYMYHVDSIGNTPETAAFKFNANPGAGFHYGFLCQGAIINWCVSTFNSGGTALANVNAGLRPDGSMLTTGIQSTGYAWAQGNLGNAVAYPSYAVYLGSNAGGGSQEGDVVGVRGLNLYAVAPSASTALAGVAPAVAILPNGTTAFGGLAKLAAFTVAALPACTPGQEAYASNGRNNGEAASAGTGLDVTCNSANHWIAPWAGAAVTQ